MAQQPYPFPVLNAKFRALAALRDAEADVAEQTGNVAERLVDIASRMEEVAARLPGEDYWKALANSATQSGEQFDRLCNALAGRPGNPLENPYCLAVVLFESSGKIVETTNLGKTFAKIAGAHKVLTIDDLAYLATAANQAGRRRKFIEDLENPEKWDDLGEHAARWDFQRLIELSPGLRDTLRLAHSSPNAAQDGTSGPAPGSLA